MKTSIVTSNTCLNSFVNERKIKETVQPSCTSIPNCKSCVNNPKICDECFVNFFRSPDQADCPPCPPNCLTCGSNSNQWFQTKNCPPNEGFYFKTDKRVLFLS